MVVKRVGERGFGLILALMLLALLSMLVAAMLTVVTLEGWIGDNYRREMRLVYVTEAGIEEGREVLRSSSITPSTTPFIEAKPLLDPGGREAGRYSVTLVRLSPLTLRSAGEVGNARKTIDVRLRKSGFPIVPNAITLNEDVPLPVGSDPKLETPEGLEWIVDGILRHATEVYSPGLGETFSLGLIGSPSDYRVVVVNGNAAFGNATGHGLLLVRGEMTVFGTFAWHGLVLIIGQGVMRAADGATGSISGAVFITRTRADDRSPGNPLGTRLERRGALTFELPAGGVTVSHSEEEMALANALFPYVPTRYREY
jgi:hypothetical protein